MPARLIAFIILTLSCGNAQVRQGSGDDAWSAARARMVEQQLKRRDIRDPRVLDALRRVPRHLFVPAPVRSEAYGDHPLPIGHQQTISQPYIVAFMTEALDVQPAHKVLEIGTGSGYQAAVLAELARDVYTIEIVEPLANGARRTLAELGYRNVHTRTGNGYAGWPEEAPFDRIMVTAAPPEVPPALVEQLKMDGLIAIPVGTTVQELRIMRRTKDGLAVLKTLPVRFVPMTGKPRVVLQPFFGYYPAEHGAHPHPRQRQRPEPARPGVRPVSEHDAGQALGARSGAAVRCSEPTAAGAVASRHGARRLHPRDRAGAVPDARRQPARVDQPGGRTDRA